MSNDSTQSFKDAFGQFLKEEHLDQKFQQKRLIESWERIMGRPIASRTTKMFFKGKTLFVELSSASLKDELNRSTELVLSRIRENSEKMIVDQVKFI